MPQFSKVNSQYGAPMGRGERHGLPDESIGRCISLFRVRLDSGGYDDGGAYWGIETRGEYLYCAQNVSELGNEYREFVRAADRDSAADALAIPDEFLIQPRKNKGGALYAFVRSADLYPAVFDLAAENPAPEFTPNNDARDIFDYRAMRKLCRVSGLALGSGAGYDPDQCFRELIRPVRRYARLVTLDESGEFLASANPK